MGERAFVARAVVGWAADRSLPEVGRLVVEPHSGHVYAIDVIGHGVLPLGAGTHRQVEGPEGTYVLDGVWHPVLGLLLAFGRTRGRGPWSLAQAAEDGSIHDIGMAKDVPVMSMCLADSGEVVLGVASVEASGGRQVGGGIASFDPRTRTLSWLYAPPSGEHFVPSGICWDRGAVLFVHTRRHALMRLTPHGDLECVVGRLGRPDSDARSLNNPTGVSVADDCYLVTDRGNHRVQLIDRDGQMLESFGDHLEGPVLADPRHAVHSAGEVYVVDRGARAVLELSADLRSVRRRWGGDEATGLVLSRPRSIDRSASGELVVADTNRNRILGVGDDGRSRWEIRAVTLPGGGVEGLRWPRCARISDAGRLVVADGLSSRFLVIGRDGVVETAFSRVTTDGGSHAASDPHDGRWIGEDELLLVDSAAGWVARARCDGSALWVLADLVDPHQADLFRDGVVVADPEMNAVLLVDAETGVEVWRRSEFLDAAGRIHRVVKPRVVRATADEVLIVDSDCRVIALGEDWSVQWFWDGIARHGGSAHVEAPEAPRDLVVDGPGRLLVSDYRNGCVVELAAVAVPVSTGETG